MVFSNRKFGVEIEYIGISRANLRKLLIDNGFNCHPRDRGDLNQWCVVYDGSISNPDDDAGELISPILCGQEGLSILSKVIILMSKNGAKVDKTCGLHVHVDANELTCDEIKTIANRYARFEKEIDLFMPVSRRGNNNNYCFSMSNSDILNDIEDCFNIDCFADIERYYKLNVHSCYKHGTIEFRQHSGTINFEKISNWIKFCIGFVEESKNVFSKIKNLQVDKKILETYLPLEKIKDTKLLKIINRELLKDTHFRNLTYSEQYGLVQPVKYTIRALINGFDIYSNNIYTYSKGTIRRAMSVLRAADFKIAHQRGTGFYIFEDVQPISIFNNNIQNRFLKNEDNRNIKVLYDSINEDNLFKGMEEEIISFYNERAIEFEQTLSSGRII